MCIWMPQSETNLVFGSEPARKLKNFNISLHTCLVFWALALIKHFQKICLTKCRHTVHRLSVTALSVKIIDLFAFSVLREDKHDHSSSYA